MAWRDFRRAPWRYLVSRGRLAGQLAELVRGAKRQRRPERSWGELIAFVNDAAGSFLKPLQIGSEIERAMEEVERARPRFLLEIGTARGGTFFLLSRAAASDACILSLDLPAGRWGGGYSAWKALVFRRLLLPGQSGAFIRADSHAPESVEGVRKRLAGNRLDVLFIDGDHSYEGVKTDFERYLPFVRAGGMVILHDIARHETRHQCHVDRFWAEIKNRYPSREIVEDPAQGWAGIGVVWNAPAAPVRTAAG